MRNLLCALFVIFACLWTATVNGQQSFDPAQAHYLWPTEASHYLTSTFAETRSGHFHAALDIKTWGRRGYEVYATRDGIVDRIAIGPKGYGKVVYLKHPDGSFSVYAHLLSFNSQLQHIADSARFAQDYQFQTEQYLGWRNIKVEQGDVIGYSGASGIGPPHLHFELRTPSQKPFNPLLTNLKVQDNIAPQIMGLSIEPLSLGASIEGKNAIYKQRVWGQKEIYDFGTIDVSGPVGLGINAFDQSNDVYNSYAVYELSMSVDGQQLFKSRADSFSYDETDQMFLDRVYPILKEDGRGYQRLYVADGNTLPFYTTGAQNGVLNLSPGIHSVTIRATDYFGNTTTATLTLDVQKQKNSHPHFPQRPVPNETNTLPNTWSWFHNWVTLTKEQFRQVTIAAADSSAHIHHQNGVAVNLSKRKQLFMNIPGMSPIILNRVNPHSLNIVTSANQQNFAIFPENTVYDTVSVGMSVHHFSADSITVDMLPAVYPIRSSYTFHIQRDKELTDTTKLSFYKFDREDNDWKLIPTSFGKNYIVGKTKSLGRFILRSDTTAPRLFDPRLTQRPDGQWVIMIQTTDNLSGIDYSKAEISVDGIRGIAEYEPEDERLVYYHPNFQPSSLMKVEVVAFDKMGNRTVEIFNLKTKHTKK